MALRPSSFWVAKIERIESIANEISLKERPPIVRVRDFRIGDLATAAELVSSIPLWQRYGYTEGRCARDLRAAARRRDRLKVAVSGKTIVGLAWVLPLGGFGRFPYLKILAVHESARDRGAGAALLEAAEAGGDLLLLVSDFNRRGRRFYEAHGYLRWDLSQGWCCRRSRRF